LLLFLSLSLFFPSFSLSPFSLSLFLSLSLSLSLGRTYVLLSNIGMSLVITPPPSLGNGGLRPSLDPICPPLELRASRFNPRYVKSGLGRVVKLLPYPSLGDDVMYHCPINTKYSTIYNVYIYRVSLKSGPMFEVSYIKYA
jgi:hypothetical protein